MVDVDSVVGEPSHTPDGVTLIPVSKVSVGFGGGGTDFVNSKGGENPFGGGVGGPFEFWIDDITIYGVKSWEP